MAHLLTRGWLKKTEKNFCNIATTTGSMALGFPTAGSVAMKELLFLNIAIENPFAQIYEKSRSQPCILILVVDH